MDLPTVAIAQPTLPSPLPTDWQQLCDLFYDHFQALTAQVRDNNAKLCEGCDDMWIAPGIAGMMRGPTQQEIAAVMPAKVNAAVVLANYNYQVGNGGHMQHDDNRYSGGVDTLVTLFDGANKLDIVQAGQALAIVEEYRRRLQERERASSPMGFFATNDDGDECLDEGNPFDDLDDRWYALDTQTLCQAVLDRFEDVLAASFMPVMRKAA